MIYKGKLRLGGKEFDCETIDGVAYIEGIKAAEWMDKNHYKLPKLTQDFIVNRGMQEVAENPGKHPEIEKMVDDLMSDTIDYLNE